MNNGSYVLRPEARPMPYEALNESQLTAMKAVVAALKEAVDQAKSSGKHTNADGFIDRDRVSRLYFVSGQPGSGKTSIYVTLRALLSRGKQHPKNFRKKYACEIPGLNGLNGAIRWLEPMDLEVAGDEGENLLAAVLVRIFGAIDGSSRIPSKDCRDAMAKLSELENDIGIAWEGNLRKRAASLDPDSYSQEAMRAQRTKLGTNNRLREALEGLLKHDCNGYEREEIFVLPIDDFYLKPTASLELLRLLRMVSVPRLFFLIMGDIKTMEALFFEKALADWTRIAGPQVFASLEKRSEEEILPRIREMKARYLRKLLPPEQRATIGCMRWDEALQYNPPASASSDCTLRQLLSKIPVSYRVCPKSESSPMTLLDFLSTPKCPEGQTKDASKSKELKAKEKRLRKLQEAYSALLILDATPREVADLWMGLEPLADEQDDDEENRSYLRKVVEFALLAIEEQDYLTEEQQDILRFAFPTSSVDDLLFQTHNLSLRAKGGLPQKIKCGDAFVRKHLDWKLGFSDDKGTVGPVPFLPPRTAAWIILLHDLTWSWKPDRITKNLVYDLRVRLSKEKSCKRPTLETLGWAWRKNNYGLWVHFSMPRLTTFRQLDRFLAVWNDVLPSIPTNLSLGELARLWDKAKKIAEGPDYCYDKFACCGLKLPENGQEDSSGIEEPQ